MTSVESLVRVCVALISELVLSFLALDLKIIAMKYEYKICRMEDQIVAEIVRTIQEVACAS